MVIPHDVIIGALSGTAFALIVQYALYRYRIRRAARRFGRDLANLRRHLAASLQSLDFDVSKPVYFFAARLRYCKFGEGNSAFGDLEWLIRRRDAARILPRLIALRNYNIFMEEIAARADTLDHAARLEAIAEARVNIEILQRKLDELGEDGLPDASLFSPGRR
jgi:hypothetical protein